jgi:F5/8 type C domain
VRQLHRSVNAPALNAVARASTNWSSEYAADQANDGNLISRWNSATSPNAIEWLELDFGEPMRFREVAFIQFTDRINGYNVQGWNGHDWSSLVEGGWMGLNRSPTAKSGCS